MSNAIDASLKRVAAAVAKAAGETPIGAAAGERKAKQRRRCDVIVHAGGETESLRGHIARSGGSIAVGDVAAAIAGAPGAPALVEGQLRGFQHRRISERNVRRQVRRVFRRKGDGLPAGTGTAAASDERIEHQTEKLGHHLERIALGAGRRFAVQLGKAAVEAAASEPEQGAEKLDGKVPPALKTLLSAFATLC